MQTSQYFTNTPPLLLPRASVLIEVEVCSRMAQYAVQQVMILTLCQIHTPFVEYMFIRWMCYYSSLVDTASSSCPAINAQPLHC